MATKAYQTRFIEMSSDLRAALWRTHYVFSELLRQMVQRYVAMRKGRFGSKVQRIAQILLSSGNTAAHGMMDALSDPQWRGQLDNEWSNLAREVRVEDHLLFEKHKSFGEVDGRRARTARPGGSGVAKSETKGEVVLSTKFWHQVCDDASACLKGYAELLKNWHKEREQWLEERAAWCEKNPEFMAFWNGLYQQFEKECERKREEAQKAVGQKVTKKKRESRQRGKRIPRWHLWYEFILAHPEIIEWRGKAEASAFKAVPADVQKKIRQKENRQDKYISKFLDWMKESNPELEVLDRARRFYLRNYNRFKRPPTLTYPSPTKHPRWFNMEKDIFYKDFDPESGTIRVCLIDEDEHGIWFMRWFDARLKTDPRLKPSYRNSVFKTQGRLPPYMEGKIGRKLDRPAESPEERKAGIKGAKLIVKKNAARLVFTVVEQDCPRRVSDKKVKWWNSRSPANSVLDPEGKPSPLRLVTLDLGIRHVAAYSVSEGSKGDNGWDVKWLKKGILKAVEIPGLYQIRGHKRDLRKGRRERGKPVPGERSYIELQHHQTHMADDRFKKASSEIIETARAHDAHMIIFEKLDTLKATAEDERWANRQLRDMNRRKIVEAVKHAAEEFGIYVDDGAPPYHTSHICSRCHKPGFRFSMKSKNPWKEKIPRKQCKDFGYPVWDRGGHLFRCPHCAYKVNADINAAANLANRFFGKWPRDVKSEKWLYTWKEGKTKHRFHAREEFDKWAEDVKQRKEIKDAPF